MVLLVCLMLSSLVPLNLGFLTENVETDNNQRIDKLSAQLATLAERVGVVEEQSQCACRVLTDCPDGWTRNNGSCYFFGVIPEIWKDAEVTCERLGGHLAVIETAEEDTFIGNFIKRSRNETIDLSHGYTWVGGYDFLIEGKWMWITGKPFSYTNWRGNNPTGHGEDCLDWSNGWNDHACTFAANFVCERRTLTLR